MGGFLSGNTSYRHNVKATVEQCFALKISTMLRDDNLWAGASGTYSWSHGFTGERLASMGFTVLDDDYGQLILRLNYRVDSREDIELSIPLQSTKPQFGGVRWWLTCPLMNGDRPCARRVAKLYLRNRYFGCRQCLDLTYHSAQHAHEYERAIAKTPRFRIGFEDMMRRVESRRSKDLDMDHMA